MQAWTQVVSCLKDASYCQFSVVALSFLFKVKNSCSLPSPCTWKTAAINVDNLIEKNVSQPQRLPASGERRWIGSLSRDLIANTQLCDFSRGP